jgi:serine/threonine protein kinase
MSLTTGKKLGTCEILAPLGAGGMGEVYRARDTVLGREVAVKVLPAGFATDPDRLRRFSQEAQAAASLNHPNVLAIYHVDEQDGAPLHRLGATGRRDASRSSAHGRITAAQGR